MFVCLFDLMVHVVDSGMKNKLTVYSHSNACFVLFFFFLFFLGGGGGGRGDGARVIAILSHFGS